MTSIRASLCRICAHIILRREVKLWISYICCMQCKLWLLVQWYIYVYTFLCRCTDKQFKNISSFRCSVSRSCYWHIQQKCQCSQEHKTRSLPLLGYHSDSTLTHLMGWWHASQMRTGRGRHEVRINEEQPHSCLRKTSNSGKAGSISNYEPLTLHVLVLLIYKQYCLLSSALSIIHKNWMHWM